MVALLTRPEALAAADKVNTFVGEFFENSVNVSSLRSHLAKGLEFFSSDASLIEEATDHAFDLLADYTAVNKYISELDDQNVVEMLNELDYQGVVNVMVSYWATGLIYERQIAMEDIY